MDARLFVYCDTDRDEAGGDAESTAGAFGLPREDAVHPVDENG